MSDSLKLCKYCGESIYRLKDGAKWVPVDADSVFGNDTTYDPTAGHERHQCKSQQAVMRRAYENGDL